ncbi:MAG: serine protease [Elusimicrobiota bacterium]|nr:serine protease [Elusimicrobiota bacterium]
MKLFPSQAVALGALLLAAPAFAQVGPDVIYGSDDRLDLYQVQNTRLLEAADSTVALFSAGDVSVAGNRANLSVSHYGRGMSLCTDEPFYDQVNGAFCSGSLVAPDVIMTAGHCVRSESACQGTKFVFGFGVKSQGVMPSSVGADDVYSCKKLIAQTLVGNGADFALIRLDRPVTGRAPLRFNRGGDPANGTPLVVIGHPAGLPTKIAGGAKVRDASPNGYFVANLDTYGGNSGSAVFNATNLVIEGILVRGENDYVWRGSCRVSQQCADDACRGEDVTKMTSVLPSLPGTAGEAAASYVVRPETVLSTLKTALESNP